MQELIKNNTGCGYNVVSILWIQTVSKAFVTSKPLSGMLICPSQWNLMPIPSLARYVFRVPKKFTKKTIEWCHRRQYIRTIPVFFIFIRIIPFVSCFLCNVRTTLVGISFIFSPTFSLIFKQSVKCTRTYLFFLIRTVESARCCAAQLWMPT